MLTREVVYPTLEYEELGGGLYIAYASAVLDGKVVTTWATHTNPNDAATLAVMNLGERARQCGRDLQWAELPTAIRGKLLLLAVLAGGSIVVLDDFIRDIIGNPLWKVIEDLGICRILRDFSENIQIIVLGLKCANAQAFSLAGG